MTTYEQRQLSDTMTEAWDLHQAAKDDLAFECLHKAVALLLFHLREHDKAIYRLANPNP